MPNYEIIYTLTFIKLKMFSINFLWNFNNNRKPLHIVDRRQISKYCDGGDFDEIIDLRHDNVFVWM